MHQTIQLPRYKHRLNDTRLPLPEEGTSQLQYTPLSPFVLHRARIGICTVPRGAISKLRDPFTSSPRYSLSSPPHSSPSLIVPLGVRFNRPSGRIGIARLIYISNTALRKSTKGAFLETGRRRGGRRRKRGGGERQKGSFIRSFSSINCAGER